MHRKDRIRIRGFDDILSTRIAPGVHGGKETEEGGII
jgi:hypothetical protein